MRDGLGVHKPLVVKVVNSGFDVMQGQLNLFMAAGGGSGTLRRATPIVRPTTAMAGRAWGGLDARRVPGPAVRKYMPR